MKLHNYFDKIYLLNLHKRSSRLKTISKKMHMCDIQFEVFGATDGSVIEKADLLNPNRIIKLNVDSDEIKSIVKELGIQSIPTTLTYNDSDILNKKQEF